MSDAVERARQALDSLTGPSLHWGISDAERVKVALRDLLAEIDAHWIDTRDLWTLADATDPEQHERVVGISYDPDTRVEERWQAYTPGDVWEAATAAEAIRAAREATNA